MEDVGRVTALLLAVLRALRSPSPDERHGFAIAKRVDAKPSTVYPVLDRLEQARWITAARVPNPVPTRPPRRVYSLTDEGRTRAQALLASRDALVDPPDPAKAKGRRRRGSVASPALPEIGLGEVR